MPVNYQVFCFGDESIDVINCQVGYEWIDIVTVVCLKLQIH